LKRGETLLLSRADVRALLDLEECIGEVEQGFRMLASGEIPAPGVLGLHAADGGIHIKAAYRRGERAFFAAKANTNFPRNPGMRGLPTIQGVIVLCDAHNGELLALMDSIEITIQRTGAATAVAAKYLARSSARIATICGCGNQGRVQLAALRTVLPLEMAFLYDLDESAARGLAAETKGLKTVPTFSIEGALRESDVVATCTPSQKYIIGSADIRPGTFIAAVGADSEHKQELDPALFGRAKVVVDSRAQCANIGDLHHAIAAGTITAASIHAELAEVVAGSKPGRTSEDEITIFDSTGVAAEDVVSAIYVYEKAVASGRGVPFRFAS
jgi:alanine dehydrogenase